MGHFPSMVRPTKEMNTFTVSVNQLGEGVIHHIDNNGKPTGFVVFQTPYQLLRGLASELGQSIIVESVDLLNDKFLVHKLCPHCNTWAELAALLNRRPRTAEGHRAAALVESHKCVWFGREWGQGWAYLFVRYEWQKGKPSWTVTTQGLEWDAKHWPPEPPPDPAGSTDVSPSNPEPPT